MSDKKVVLIILDGWGIGDKTKADAITSASTPFYDSCLQKYPHSTLKTFGEFVGLPDGQMGNSEVGHLNIGAGRVVYQDLVKINKAIKDKTIDTNPVIQETFNYVKSKGKKLHLMGLVSDGGIHSHSKHLEALIDLAEKAGIEKTYVHAFTDGRDCSPTSGLNHIKKLEDFLRGKKTQLASMIGRYYVMDRDKRWERIKIAYDLLVNGIGTSTDNFTQSLKESYDNGVTDEFLKPLIRSDRKGTIEENDAVICFNFRTDRCREITTVLTQQDMHEQNMHTLSLHYVTMTNYDSTFKNVHIIFDKDNLKNTLGEVLADNGKKQIRIAETEKYPHVTFFFSGGREKEFKGESRIMINSPKVATYDLQPEMSANEVTDAIVNELNKGEVDFVCLNFANPDMVGHTGVYDAIVKAIETTDKCAEKVINTAINNNYSVIIIADHGNADIAFHPDGSPHTAHTTNPVPCILIDKDYKKLNDGKLADISPTILKLMGIAKPKEMDGIELV